MTNSFLIRVFWIALLIFSFVVDGNGQARQAETQMTEQELRDRIEAIADQLDADLDYSELIENLRYYLERPLNLNFASREDLSKLIFLNEIQIYHIIAYRETYGYFTTLYELQGIEGMDDMTIQLILPFIEVTPVKPAVKFTPGMLMKKGKHLLLGRYQQILQQKQGYAPLSDSAWEARPNSHYLGGPEKLLFRYGYNSFNKLRAGITAEKDPGEPIFKSGINDSIKDLAGSKLSNGFDFVSFHAGIFDLGHLKALSLGDYQLRFGQGLTMWSGLAFGKSGETGDLKKFQQGVTPYTSSDENRFFRGVASTFQYNRFDLTLFYSKTKVDATIEEQDSLSQQEMFISNLQESGLHRTITEVNKKDALAMTVYGGNLSFRHRRFSVGFTGFYSRFEQSLDLTGALYNRYYFSGKENINAGLDYSYLLGNVSFYGEISRSMNGGYAQLHGMTASLHPRLFFSLLYRNYSREYQNFFCNPFAESNAFNEEGIYAGIKFSLAPKWTLSGYMDHFRFPWLRYYVNKPAAGSDYLLKLENRASDEVFMSFRIRQKNSPQNLTGDVGFIKPVIYHKKTGYRYLIDYELTPYISMKDRIEYVSYRESSGYWGSGYLVYHDINWLMLKEKLTWSFRYAIFDTDSYDERIYAFESDMLYAFSVPAYYYKGSKIYLMARYNVGQHISCWARISHIWLANDQHFGSGLEEIEGNQKTEVKFQFVVRI